MPTLDTSVRYKAAESDAMTPAEWDAYWVTDWLASRAYNNPPPPSAEPGLDYAHWNEAAWPLVNLPQGMDGLEAWQLLESAAELDATLRFNPNHDSSGKFSSGPGGGGGGGAVGTLERPGRVPSARPSSGGADISDAKAKDLHSRLQEPDGGFTMDPRTGKDVTRGYAVAAYPERSKEIPLAQLAPSDLQAYAANNADLLNKSGHMFGGWHDPETGHVWLDVSIVMSNKQKAIKVAQDTNQIAIFDLSNFESIPTGGTGAAL